MEIALYQSGAIPRALHLTIQQGFLTLGLDVQKGLTVLRDLTQTPMQQQAAVTQIEASMTTFINSLSSLNADAKTKITTVMNAALLIVQGAFLLI